MYNFFGKMAWVIIDEFDAPVNSLYGDKKAEPEAAKTIKHF